MSALYGTPYSTITLLRFDQPVEEQQQLVDALFSLATSAKGLLLSYKTFLSNSMIYALDPSPSDDGNYQQDMQKIKEEQATIPRIMNAIPEQVRTQHSSLQRKVASCEGLPVFRQGIGL